MSSVQGRRRGSLCRRLIGLPDVKLTATGVLPDRCLARRRQRQRALLLASKGSVSGGTGRYRSAPGAIASCGGARRLLLLVRRGRLRHGTETLASMGKRHCECAWAELPVFVPSGSEPPSASRPPIHAPSSAMADSVICPAARSAGSLDCSVHPGQLANQRARRLEPKCSFSATRAADGALKVPVRVGPDGKSMSTRPTRP